ncbi:MAG: hypothetical protein NWR51_05405 [Akkermansiaceae bacterium]|nr:hypothetical protein [Akkermansiaceae bacterium]
MKTLLALFLAISPLAANPDSFRELFADPATRSEAIATLTPGTRDAFFFTALDHQLSGREKEYATTITAWKAAADRKKSPVSPQGMEVLENRRILLTYDRDPQAALKELTRRLDLTFDHSKPASPTADLELPTSVDPALISDTAFREEADQAQPSTPYRLYSQKALATELDSLDKFNDERIRWFAGNFEGYDHPSYTALITKTLALDPPYEGSELPFNELTLAQLKEIIKSTPALLGKSRFVSSYLTKLTPSHPAELERHPAAHAAFLAACRDFALTLPPSRNDLRAHILYHHLRLQQTLGNHPLNDFVAYLTLPRRNHRIIQAFEKSEEFFSPTSDLNNITLSTTVSNDTELIESYLLHFLALSDTAQKPFVPYIQEKELAALHARARLLAGASTARWAPALAPEEYASLREETRITFSPTVPSLFSAEEKISLPLDLKNTPTLLIRIHEIVSKDTAPSVDLEGLVPHHTRTLSFDQQPLVLHRENIDLPELEGAGTWIVEFVSERISARALIQKGNITPHITRTPEGQVIRVFDEASHPLGNFTLELGDDTFTAKDGTITVPDSANQPVTSGKLTAGKLITEISLDTRTDSLGLDASFFLDRGQLIAGEKTTLHLDAKPTNHGLHLPVERLESPSLVMKAELLGGTTTERIIAEKLDPSGINAIPILVPADLLSLSFVLTATATPTTGEEPVTLTSTASFELNADLKSKRIATALFSETQAGHSLELRGRNGEPLPSRAIRLTFTHHLYDCPIVIRLRTDDSGRISLGTLDGITEITANSSDIAPTTYVLPIRILELPTDYVIPADRELRIPIDPTQGKSRLVRLAKDDPAEDFLPSPQAAIKDNHLVLNDLPPATYRYTQGELKTKITVLPGGSKRGDLIVTEDNILPLTIPTSPLISSAVAGDKNLSIRIEGASPTTRVTVSARRFDHGKWDPGYAFYPFAQLQPSGLTRSVLPSRYLTGRLLSDEARYILDRRAAKTFPGTMLPRPGQLLYRWTPEDIDQENQDGDDDYRGESLPSLDGGGGTTFYGQKTKRGRSSTTSHPTVIDFLKSPSTVSFALTPDADGLVSIPLSDFGDARFLTIFAADTDAWDILTLPLPDAEIATRDRRIARPLNPAEHHIPTRFAAALAPGAEVTINNLLDADWRAFTTLEEAHRHLLAVTGDDRLRTFTFLTTWPDLDEKEKLNLLADHHCHELHLFLQRKDPDFFKKHVLPFLAAKPQPTFMDDYLLGRDLTPYLRPYAFPRLNAAEKALLARALPARGKDIARELDLRWKTEAPSPEAETRLFSQTLKGADLSPDDSLGLAYDEERSKLLANVDAAWQLDTSRRESTSGSSDGVAYITEKLRRIVIPNIDFEDTTLEEAIDFLRLRAAELDSLELDPSRKGMNFVIRRPRSSSNGDGGLDASSGGGLLGGGDPGAVRIDELRLKNVPLDVALKYIADKTKMRFKVDDYAITMVPQTETGEDYYTRTFRVPPDFADSLQVESGANLPIIDLLRQSGISFPDGSSATLTARGALIVTNSPSELNKIDQLTQSLSMAPPETDEADPFAEVSDFDLALLPPLEDLPSDKSPRSFPNRTHLWLESNYYENRNKSGEELIPLNRYWLELAGWDQKKPFTSPHFNACTASAADALMCLATLELPFTAEKPEVAIEGGSLRVKARAPMLLFYKDTRITDKLAPEPPLLVRQSYHPLAEPFQTDAQGRKIENTLTGELRTGVPYGLSLVVTNPTGTERRIETLAQIPAGSIPLDGMPETLSTSHQLAPYGVVRLRLAFYFPAAGDFPAYPLHVAEDGTVLAHADARTLRVSNEPAPEDAASWLALARDGTSEAVLARLSTANPAETELNAILWRLRDKDFFQKTTTILRQRLWGNEQALSYAVLHNDKAALSDFIETTPLARNLGTWFSSDLVNITPAEHHLWEPMEFDPLVNPRAHPFGNHPRLSHEAALEHYREFLDTLSWKAELSAEDNLTLTYHLFVQDRIEEALTRFEKIDPTALTDTLRYDYLHTLALFHQSKPEEAKTIATTRLADLPPGTWRERFTAVSTQADEIAAPLTAAPEQEKEAAPTLEITRESDDAITLRHSGLDEAELRLYHIDLEVLFSKDPFLKGGMESSLPPIAPNLSAAVKFEKGSEFTPFQLPEDFRKGNLFIAAESDDTQRLEILGTRLIELRILPADRTVLVTDTATGKPLPNTYIKVYSEARDGSITFHKDGYTDLRGKFDHISHTATDPSTLKRFAILASHPEKGSLTRIIQR